MEGTSRFLKNVKCRVPYFTFQLQADICKELEEKSKAELKTSLRFNRPIGAGLKFNYKGKECFATISNKKLLQGKYLYFLESE